MSRINIFFLLLVAVIFSALFAEAVPSNLQLVNAVIVSRHGVRSPYPPPNSTSASDVSMYTNLKFPTWQEWGYTSEEQYANQDLTPHGITLVPLVGSYYNLMYKNLTLDVNCDKVWTYADFTSGNSTRDIQTARLWLSGFGCDPDSVKVVTTDNINANMAPVLSDHYNNGCALPDEEQIDGLYGGNVNALTNMYEDGIQKIQDILKMPGNASICKNVNPNFNKNDDCTFFETGYEFTGLYFQGEFLSPIYYASYFAETWMLQYVSNISNWAFNELNLNQLTDLYNLHIKSLSFGMNYWTSQAYSSQQMAYVVASLYQRVINADVEGVNQPNSNNLLLLVSHDTNILYLGTLLNLNWIPLGYGNNVASTAGTLVFELYQDTTAGNSVDSFYVKVHYDAASPDQQRNADILTVENPLSVANLVIPECGEEYCPWSKFVQVTLGSINLDCIAEPLQSTVKSLYYGSSSNDDDSTYEVTSVAIYTASACVAACTLLIIVALYCYNKKKEQNLVDNKLLLVPLMKGENDLELNSSVKSSMHSSSSKTLDVETNSK